MIWFYKENMMKAVGKSGKIILMESMCGSLWSAGDCSAFFCCANPSNGHWSRSNLVSIPDFYDGLVHQMPKIWESLKHAIRFSLPYWAPMIRPFMFRLIQPSQLNGDGVQCSGGCCGGQGSFAFYQKDLSNQELWDIVQSSRKRLPMAIHLVSMQPPPAESSLSFH